MPPEVESAKRDWEDAYRRYEAELRDPAQAARLVPQVGVLREELAKHIGATFTIAELAAEYRRAESWARETLAERMPTPGWPRTLAEVQGAAFHLYSRGALDYEP